MVFGINLGCVNILLQRDIIFFIPVGWFHNCVIKRALASEVFLGQWWALIGHMILCGDERNRAREFFLTQCFGGLGSGQAATNNRSEEHTSELQSRFAIVCRLLLDKKTPI